MLSGGASDELRSRLWNTGVTADDYGGDKEKYQAAVLEQYKIYVEMADRVSARKATANTFFLTLDALVFALLGVTFALRPVESPGWLMIPLAALLAECAAWFYWPLPAKHRVLVP